MRSRSTRKSLGERLRPLTHPRCVVTVGSDEGSYDEVTAQERIEQGYRVFELKPIAKTLTKMLRVAKVAHDHDLPAYCADLTA